MEILPLYANHELSLRNCQHSFMVALLCDRFVPRETQWIVAQVENAKQQAILTAFKGQVTSDEAHIHLDLHSLR